jgi:arsenate reductase
MSMCLDETSAIEGLGSLAQPTRLAVVRRLLAMHPQSSTAGEIARFCDVPHNTMSAHLAILMRAGLVTVARRGRAMNYSADPRTFRELVGFLARDCCGGQPNLCADILRGLPEDTNEAEENFMSPSFNVLFLCTHNSARSIMAEALLEKIGKGRFRAYSAGSHPAAKPLPEVVERLKALGHDVSHLRSKSWHEFARSDAPRMDFIISLCETTDGEICPDLGAHVVTATWPLPNPARFTGSPAERTTLLNELYAMIRRRLEIFTSLPLTSLDKMAVKFRLDEIGDTIRTAP